MSLSLSLLVVVPAFAAGKAAPKATGSVGYTAYSDVQRNVEFNAISTSTDCAYAWDVRGTYLLTLTYGGVYTHDLVITVSNQEYGTFSGTGGYPSSGPPYSINETINGTVSGDTIQFIGAYNGSSYVYTVDGTINPNGSISVTGWYTNAGQSGTTNMVISGNVTKVMGIGCTGKGTFNYSDESGYYYTVDVQYVKVDGNKAWFAGPVVSGNVGLGSWLFAEVLDGGEPAVGVDGIWGSFTNESAAKTGVALMTAPSDGPFYVTSGNLQVH